MSVWPPGVVPIIGLPLLIASCTTLPNGSGHSEGATPSKERSHAAITASCGKLFSTLTPSGQRVGVSCAGNPINTSGGACLSWV